MIHEDQNLARLGLKFRGVPGQGVQNNNEAAIRIFLADLKKKFSFDNHGSAL